MILACPATPREGIDEGADVEQTAMCRTEDGNFSVGVVSQGKY